MDGSISKEVDLTEPTPRELATSAREWVASPEGQQAILQALEEARIVTEQLKPKPLNLDSLREPLI